MNALLPTIFVPLITLIFPAMFMTSMFLYIEKDELI